MAVRFCPLCGVWMLKGAALGTPGQEWLYELRVVRSTKTPLNPHLTGIGYLDHWNPSFIGPTDSGVRHSDENVLLEECDIYNPDAVYWAFPLHNACWKIFSVRVCGSELVEMSVVNFLFRLLVSASVDKAGYHSFCQDLGVANGIQQPDRILNRLTLNYGPPRPVLLVDPLPTLDLFRTRKASNNHTEVPDTSFDWGTRVETQVSSILDRLPDELLHLILKTLPSKDVAQLRLASRAVARVSSVHALQQSFWKSRFSDTMEMGFASFLLADSGATVDFRDWYMFLKNALLDTDSYLYLQNWRRIWIAISQVVHIADFVLSVGGIQGEEFLRAAYESDEPLTGPNIGPEISADIDGDKSLTKTRLYRGCRQLEVKQLLLPRSTGKVRIGVSTLVFDNRKYISGLRIIDDHHRSKSAMGIITQNDESYYVAESANDLHGVELALVSTGIVSLRFLSGGISSPPSTWFGTAPDQIIEAATTRLLIREQETIYGFWAGFDVCKLVSFGLLRIPCREILPSNRNPQIDSIACSKSVWRPRFPYYLTASNHQIEPPLCQPTSYKVNLAMDFGGKEGELLGSLTRIFVSRCQRTGAVTSLDFRYETGIVKSYGRFAEADIQQTFLIDGPGGERVVRTESYLRDDSSWGLQEHRLSILHTNFGNSFNFEYGCEKRGVECRILEASNDRIITGFIATEEAIDGAIELVSLVTCKAIEGVSLDYRTKEAKRKCANDTVREIVESSSARADTCSSHCQMNSFASLENVRRLKISRGYKNGPRARESITGIWIEYWDSAEPKIVGQWLKEGKSLDLDRGDILTEISFWTDRPRDFARGAKIGDLNITVHVVGIQLSTANGNSLFWGEMRRNRLPLIYHHNYMQRLTAISWVFGPIWDYPRIITSQNVSSESIVYQPSIPSSWKTPQIIPWEDRSPSGIIDRVRTIAFSLNSGMIAGMTFRYNSGKKRLLGKQPSDPSSYFEIQLTENENPVKLEVGWNRLKAGGVRLVLSMVLNEILLHVASPTTFNINKPLGIDVNPFVKRIAIRNGQSTKTRAHTLVSTDVANQLTSTDAKFHESPPEDSSVDMTCTAKDERTVFSCPEGMRFVGFWGLTSVGYSPTVGYSSTHFKPEITGFGVVYESIVSSDQKSPEPTPQVTKFESAMEEVEMPTQ